MSEIEKPEIKEINFESSKEKQPEVVDFESLKEDNEQKKEDLLKEIYKKEDTNVKSEVVDNDDSKKIITNFVKEVYSVGVKVIDKARKVLNPKDLDDLHDQLTDKNNK